MFLKGSPSPAPYPAISPRKRNSIPIKPWKKRPDQPVKLPQGYSLAKDGQLNTNRNSNNSKITQKSPSPKNAGNPVHSFDVHYCRFKKTHDERFNRQLKKLFVSILFMLFMMLVMNVGGELTTSLSSIQG